MAPGDEIDGIFRREVKSLLVYEKAQAAGTWLMTRESSKAWRQPLSPLLAPSRRFPPNGTRSTGPCSEQSEGRRTC
jgi:hypothetical protein